MSLKYIIGASAILLLGVIGYFSLISSSVQYASIEDAKRSGRTVQITGTRDREADYSYDTTNNHFRFSLIDDSGESILVVLEGAKPNNFELAERLVVKGRFENGVVSASHVLTKCPSKYEGTHPEGIAVE